jgi:hypothetical protein
MSKRDQEEEQTVQIDHSQAFDQEYTLCAHCKNHARCRVFYKLKGVFTNPIPKPFDQIEKVCFLCYSCFGDLRRKEGYQPLLAGTNKDNLYLPIRNLSESSDAAFQRESLRWYDQVEPLKMPPRLGEKQQ